RGGFFAERLEVCKTRKSEWSEHLRRSTSSDQLCNATTGCGTRLEPVCAPTDIQDKAFDILDRADDWSEIRRHVANPCPLPQYLGAGQTREQFQSVRRCIFQEA